MAMDPPHFSAKGLVAETTRIYPLHFTLLRATHLMASCEEPQKPLDLQRLSKKQNVFPIDSPCLADSPLGKKQMSSNHQLSCPNQDPFIFLGPILGCEWTPGMALYPFFRNPRENPNTVQWWCQSICLMKPDLFWRYLSEGSLRPSAAPTVFFYRWVDHSVKKTWPVLDTSTLDSCLRYCCRYLALIIINLIYILWHTNVIIAKDKVVLYRSL